MEPQTLELARLRVEVETLRKRVARINFSSIFPANIPDDEILHRTAITMGEHLAHRFMERAPSETSLWRAHIQSYDQNEPHDIMPGGTIHTSGGFLRGDETKIIHAECALIVPSVFF